MIQVSHTRRESNNGITIKSRDTMQCEQFKIIKLLGATPVEIIPCKSLDIRNCIIMCYLNLVNGSFNIAGYYKIYFRGGFGISKMKTYDIPSCMKTQLANCQNLFGLPTKVVCRGEVTNVELYIPRPMQCKNC